MLQYLMLIQALAELVTKLAASNREPTPDEMDTIRVAQAKVDENHDRLLALAQGRIRDSST